MPQTHDLDPRITATGGRRRNPRDPKSGYEWPGMTALPDWSRTRVHRHTRAYGCAKCGARFGSPQAVYTHLAKTHPTRPSPALGSRLLLAPLSLSEVPTGGNGHLGAKVPSVGVSGAVEVERAGA